MVVVTEIVRTRALSQGAATWLADLPDIVASLAEQWGLAVGRALTDGTEAFVAEVVEGDGTPAVLKVLVPGGASTASSEITALRLAGGRGCARLLHDDVERGALVLERLGPSLQELGLPLGRRQELLCATAAEVWRPVPDSGLPTGAERAQWLIEHIERWWNELDAPCSERTVASALSTAERRRAAHDDERAVLVHGDVHQWNLLQSGDRFKLVDPDGVVAEPECDLGSLMREDPQELLAEGGDRVRAERLASLCGLDPVAVREWGEVERVSTGLLCATLDLEPQARQLLEVADALAAARS
jgi:streptomycin 6-kinase